MTRAASAQTSIAETNQLWFDYEPIWPLSKRWILDWDNGTRFIVTSPSLVQLRLQPTMEFGMSKWMDLTGGVWLIYTNKFEAADLFETRPIVGIRLKQNAWRGIKLSNYFRAEYRIRTDLSGGETMRATRFRNRIGGVAPINNRNLSDDNTWYVVVDTERFWQRDVNVDDGFLSRQRFRAGIGRRKNSTWSYELLYIYQRSKNTATESFVTFDNILNFRVIQDFR